MNTFTLLVLLTLLFGPFVYVAWVNWRNRVRPASPNDVRYSWDLVPGQDMATWGRLYNMDENRYVTGPIRLYKDYAEWLEFLRHGWPYYKAKWDREQLSKGKQQ